MPSIGPNSGFSDSRGLSKSSVGFNAVARPSSFYRARGIITPAKKRGAPEVDYELEGPAGTSTGYGMSTTHQSMLMGPRISNIGMGAIEQTSLLGEAAKGQTKQGPLWKSRNIKSQARQGRPLGYGTVYKFV